MTVTYNYGTDYYDHIFKLSHKLFENNIENVTIYDAL